MVWSGEVDDWSCDDMDGKNGDDDCVDERTLL